MTLALLLLAAVDWVAQGNRAFASGRYDDALAAYERALAANPDTPEVLYDKGIALYRKGEFRAASQAFVRAGLGAGLRLKPKCLYNAGNACFRLAEQWAKSDRKQALGIFGRAEALYVHALKLSPGFEDAEHNLDLVRRTLAALNEPSPPVAAPSPHPGRLFGVSPPTQPPPPLPRTPEGVLERERERKVGRPVAPRRRPPAGKDW